MRNALAVLLFILCSTPAFAGGSDGKIVLESWDAAYLGESKAGHVHTITKEVNLNGEKALHTTVELRLTLKRNDTVVQMSMDTGSVESAEGKVLGVFMKQFLGKKQQTQIEGTVVGNQVQLLLNGNTRLKPAPWHGDAVGLFKQQSLFKDRELKPGDTFMYRHFEPTINLVVKTAVNAKGYRELELKGAREKTKLLLVESVPEKIEFRNGDKIDALQLPASLLWLDKNLEPVKTEFEVPGLGPIVLYRTTKTQALAPGPIAQLSDVGLGQLVRLKQRIPQPHETRAAVYRITVRNDDNAATTFSRDDRQQAKNGQGNTFELHVRSNEANPAVEDAKSPSAEFTQSSYFINCHDVKVRELAARAIGNEVDPWKRALRIERWVRDNMRVTNHEALATADHVARTLQGDCTEFAMLAAAMCRAVEVPSRTAIGLIYAEVKGLPCFAFHMWTEVWIQGRWLPIDATLGKGHVGAAHLKITDHSWHDERTMTPIVPVIRVVGRVSIDVLSVEKR